MENKQRLSEWFIRTVIAAIFSVLGFVGQDIYSDWKANKALEQATLERITVLSNLLAESKSIYDSQNFMAQRLMRLIRENHPEKIAQGLGYDETFYRMYDHFLAEEKELQTLIRSTTMHSMRRVNQEISTWLDADKVFKTESQPTRERENIAKQLRILELHLNLWHDKYNALIPNDVRRSLVYMADEKEHGRGFPVGIEELVSKIIDRWQ